MTAQMHSNFRCSKQGSSSTNTRNGSADRSMDESKELDRTDIEVKTEWLLSGHFYRDSYGLLVLARVS